MLDLFYLHEANKLMKWPAKEPEISQEFKVPSKSQPGVEHTVTVYEDGSMLCSCPAGTHNKLCSHKKKIQNRQAEKPIKLKVKTLWKGMVGIREKYYKQAKEKEKGIEITHEGRIMLIPFAEIRTKCKSKSAKPVFDKFKNEYHFLLYYPWEPTDNQQLLF